MRALPPALAAAFESGVTTLAHCWRVTPKIGDPLGFTDHDEDIAFDGAVFEAASGFETSEIERGLGLAIDNTMAAGALSSDKIEEADILRGRFDGAKVEQWLVDWRDPETRVLKFSGELGEIRRREASFEAELRGLTELLNRPSGRVYLRECDCDLGDARCGVDLISAQFSHAGVVATAKDAARFLIAPPVGFTSSWFDGGVLTWTSGGNEGFTAVVRRTRETAGSLEIELEREMSPSPQVGDGFSMVAGCDKTHEQCAAKFSNLANFRGFPFMPGEGRLTATPVRGETHDGGSLFNG